MLCHPISFSLPFQVPLLPHFADEETEIQRGTVTYSKPQSRYVDRRNRRFQWGLLALVGSKGSSEE